MPMRKASRYWYPATVVATVLVLSICAFIAGYYDFNFRAYLPWLSPILAWVFLCDETRPYFRFSWFWWTSILFVIGSGLIVSNSMLARANIILWLVIFMIQTGVFVVLVKLVSSWRQYRGLEDK